jgi:hypothetical protein
MPAYNPRSILQLHVPPVTSTAGTAAMATQASTDANVAAQRTSAAAPTTPALATTLQMLAALPPLVPALPPPRRKCRQFCRIGRRTGLATRRTLHGESACSPS